MKSAGRTWNHPAHGHAKCRRFTSLQQKSICNVTIILLSAGMIYFELFMSGIERMDKLMKLSTLILEGMQTFDNQGFKFSLDSLLAGTAESVRMVDGCGFWHEFAQVFNFGGGDLLQVMIGSAENAVPPNSENTGSTPSREHVWIPFAEDIIPDIDMESKAMWITPLICLLPRETTINYFN